MTDDEQRFWDACAIAAAAALADARWGDGGQRAPPAVAVRAADIADALLKQRQERIAAAQEGHGR